MSLKADSNIPGGGNNGWKGLNDRFTDLLNKKNELEKESVDIARQVREARGDDTNIFNSDSRQAEDADLPEFDLGDIDFDDGDTDIDPDDISIVGDPVYDDGNIRVDRLPEKPDKPDDKLSLLPVTPDDDYDVILDELSD